jgi:hypothetical protein
LAGNPSRHPKFDSAAGRAAGFRFKTPPDRADVRRNDAGGPQMKIRPLVAAVAAGALLVAIAPAPASTVAVPYVWKNCTNVHTKYPHGVGKTNARDKTSGTPVTTFKRSTRLYNIAMSYNGQRGYNLDRDHDGIACEKR